MGETLRAVGGSARGEPSPSLSYVWFRCNDGGDDCGLLEEGNRHEVRGRDVGRRLGVALVARNRMARRSDTRG